MARIVPLILAATMVSSAALLLSDGRPLSQVFALGDPEPDPGDDHRVVPDIPDPDEEDPDADPDTAIQYYNWLQWQAGQKIYNFGPKPEDLESYEKPYGELLDRLSSDGKDDQKKCDPRLEAAEAFAIGKAYKWILDEPEDPSKDASIFVNEVAEHLESDVEYRKKIYNRIEEALDESKCEVIDIGGYTSTMYMVPNEVPEHPIVAVDDSIIKDVEGDHALLFTWPDGSTLKLRIDCGYQPMIEVEKETPSTTPPSTTPPTTEPPSTAPPSTNPPPPTTTPLAPKNTDQAVDVRGDSDNAPSSHGTANTTPGTRPSWDSQKPTSVTPETPVDYPQPSTQGKQQTQTQTTPQTQSTPSAPAWGDLSQAGDTPPDAAVADDPIHAGTVPTNDGWWEQW